MYLPSLNALPRATLFTGFLGGTLGIITDSSPLKWAKIAAIMTIVNHTLFLVMNQNNHSIRDRKLRFALTAGAINTIAIIAYAMFKIIQTRGTVILLALNTSLLISRLINLDFTES